MERGKKMKVIGGRWWETRLEMVVNHPRETMEESPRKEKEKSRF